MLSTIGSAPPPQLTGATTEPASVNFANLIEQRNVDGDLLHLNTLRQLFDNDQWEGGNKAQEVLQAEVLDYLNEKINAFDPKEPASVATLINVATLPLFVCTHSQYKTAILVAIEKVFEHGCLAEKDEVFEHLNKSSSNENLHVAIKEVYEGLKRTYR